MPILLVLVSLLFSMVLLQNVLQTGYFLHPGCFYYCVLPVYFLFPDYGHNLKKDLHHSEFIHQYSLVGYQEQHFSLYFSINEWG